MSESTVRSILKRYGSASTADGPPEAKGGAGRHLKRSKRWKGYSIPLSMLYTLTSPPLRHLGAICAKHPFWGLKQLATYLRA